jgi:hypothetical protein
LSLARSNSPDAPPRDPRQECGCPRWVRCVHFDGRVLWLADEQPACAALPLHKPPGLFGVYGPGALSACNCGVNHLTFERGESDYFWSNSLPAAEAELERREEALRLEPAHA